MRCLRRAFPITASSAATLSTTMPGSGTTVRFAFPASALFDPPVTSKVASAVKNFSATVSLALPATHAALPSTPIAPR